MKKQLVRLIWRIIPSRLLEDSKGCPTELSWNIHHLLVKLHLTPELKLLTGKAVKIMWGDEEITNIQKIDFIK